MKAIFFFILFLSALQTQAQVYAEMAAGASTTKSATVSPGIGFKFKNAVVQAEIIACSNNADASYFGMRAGYNIPVGDFKVQPFFGRYYSLFSTDKLYAYKNSWEYMFGMKLYRGIWFIQFQVADKKIFSIGITEEL